MYLMNRDDWPFVGGVNIGVIYVLSLCFGREPGNQICSIDNVIELGCVGP